MIFSRGNESTGGVAPSSMTNDHFSINAYSLSIYSEAMVFVRIPNTTSNQSLRKYQVWLASLGGAKTILHRIAANWNLREDTHLESL